MYLLYLNILKLVIYTSMRDRPNRFRTSYAHYVWPAKTTPTFQTRGSDSQKFRTSQPWREDWQLLVTKNTETQLDNHCSTRLYIPKIVTLDHLGHGQPRSTLVLASSAFNCPRGRGKSRLHWQRSRLSYLSIGKATTRQQVTLTKRQQHFA